MMATQLLVVPRSIPMTFDMMFSLSAILLPGPIAAPGLQSLSHVSVKIVL
jgi:hypothetical protein